MKEKIRVIPPSKFAQANFNPELAARIRYPDGVVPFKNVYEKFDEVCELLEQFGSLVLAGKRGTLLTLLPFDKEQTFFLTDQEKMEVVAKRIITKNSKIFGEIAK